MSFPNHVPDQLSTPTPFSVAPKARPEKDCPTKALPKEARSKRSSPDKAVPKEPRPTQSRPLTPLQRELNTKRRGEIAELAFTLKAASLGFGVARPFGDSERYDVILDARDLTAQPANDADVNPEAPPDLSPPLWRVQIKCSTQLLDGLYRVNAHRRVNGRAVPYRPGEIHFFAAYIIPEDTWYIIPLAATRGKTSLLFRRRRDPKPGLYDQYREAWHLLRP